MSRCFIIRVPTIVFQRFPPSHRFSFRRMFFVKCAILLYLTVHCDSLTKMESLCFFFNFPVHFVLILMLLLILEEKSQNNEKWEKNVIHKMCKRNYFVGYCGKARAFGYLLNYFLGLELLCCRL